MYILSYLIKTRQSILFQIFSIKGKSKLYHIKTQTDVINLFQIPPKKNNNKKPTKTTTTKKQTYSKSKYGPAFLAKTFAVRKNHLLSLLLCKRLLKSGSISVAWALLCLRNLDAVFMPSGPFVVLNSLQLEGCASNDA